MARKEAEAPKAKDPYLYFLVCGKWRGEIAGVTPARPTMPDHIARLIEEEEAKARKVEARKKPSETAGNGGEEGVPTVPTEEMLSQRRQWLNRALEDPSLDDEAKDVLREALRELSPDEMAVRTVMRATNTFPKDEETGHFVVPATWFFGGLKAALIADGMFEDAAQRLVKRCVSIYPKTLDLGTSKPDRIYNANVTLGRTGPGEAQASIKRFHLVKPRKQDFEIIVKVLDSPNAKRLTDNVERTLTIVGEAGLGGGRPQFGNFDLVDCKPISPEEAKEYMELVS